LSWRLEVINWKISVCACAFETNHITFFPKAISPEASGKPAFSIFSRGGAVGSLCSQESRNEK
jgi:hypothetical protein